MSTAAADHPAAVPVPLTDLLARFVASLELAAVPPAALATARTCIMDVTGCALAGVPEPVSRGTVGFVHEEAAAPVATVYGAGMRTSAANAALANGVSGHALDFDDVSPPMRGHPSVVCAPAALATAESLDASGADALLGYVAGVEVTVCLAYALGRNHYDLGWHSTGTIGAIGAAAASARVRGLDSGRTRVALAIAASMASGLRCNFGSMTKPWHAGHAARTGVVAAALAARGFTAEQAALETRLGFVDLYTDSPDIAGAAARLGSTWSLVTPGINLKRHACCYAAHHAIDAMLEICAAHELRADQVEGVDVLVAPQGLTAVIHHRPRTGLQGKFSIPYTLAAVVVDGGLSLNSFTDERVMRPEVQALLHKVHCREAQGKPASVETPRYAEVAVTLFDGRTLQHKVSYPRGSAQAPMTAQEIEQKYRDCAAACLTPDQIDRSASLLKTLDALPDLRELMRALAGHAS